MPFIRYYFRKIYGCHQVQFQKNLINRFREKFQSVDFGPRNVSFTNFGIKNFSQNKGPVTFWIYETLTSQLKSYLNLLLQLNIKFDSTLYTNDFKKDKTHSSISFLWKTLKFRLNLELFSNFCYIKLIVGCLKILYRLFWISRAYSDLFGAQEQHHIKKQYHLSRASRRFTIL